MGSLKWTVYGPVATLLWHAFFMDYCSLGVKNIGLGAHCHLDPRDPPTSLSPAPSSILLHRWCARLPPFTSDLHLFPLAAFIYWGTSHLAHISKGTITLCCTVVFSTPSSTATKSPGSLVFGRLRKIIFHLREPSDSTFIFVLLP